jgi:hypothetical protein
MKRAARGESGSDVEGAVEELKLREEARRTARLGALKDKAWGSKKVRGRGKEE